MICLIFPDEHGLFKVEKSNNSVDVVFGQPLKIKVEATKSTCGNFSVPFRVKVNLAALVILSPEAVYKPHYD